MMHFVLSAYHTLLTLLIKGMMTGSNPLRPIFFSVILSSWQDSRIGIKIDCYSCLFCVSEVLILNYVYIFQIVMEYCGAGSVSDIMRLRRKVVSKNAKHEFWQIFYLTSFSSFSMKCTPLMYVCMKNILVCLSNVWIQEAVAKSD